MSPVLATQWHFISLYLLYLYLFWSVLRQPKISRYFSCKYFRIANFKTFRNIPLYSHQGIHTSQIPSLFTVMIGPNLPSKSWSAGVHTSDLVAGAITSLSFVRSHGSDEQSRSLSCTTSRILDWLTAPSWCHSALSSTPGGVIRDRSLLHHSHSSLYL